MTYLCARFVEDGGGPVLKGDPVREVHVVVVVCMESADSEHRFATHTHARADEVTHGRQPTRKRMVVTAEHPVEIEWEPGWPRCAVAELRRAADGDGFRMRGIHGQ